MVDSGLVLYVDSVESGCDDLVDVLNSFKYALAEVSANGVSNIC